MREIKFRAWINAEMVYMNEFYKFEFENGREYDFDYALQTNQEVMQFTGLHDRNGKEIYEGDIVDSYNNECSEIVCKLGCYYIVNPDFSPKPINALGSPSIVMVVGNIYEGRKEETK